MCLCARFSPGKHPELSPEHTQCWEGPDPISQGRTRPPSEASRGTDLTASIRAGVGGAGPITGDELLPPCPADPGDWPLVPTFPPRGTVLFPGRLYGAASVCWPAPPRAPRCSRHEVGPVQLQRCDHPEDRAAGLLETEAAPQGAGPRAQAPRAGGLQACPPPGPLQVRSPGASAPGEKGRAAGDPGGLQLPWLRPVQLSYHPSDRPWGCLPRRPSQLLQAGPRIWAQ